MTVTYLDATRADAPALHQIYTTVFCDTFAHLYRPEDLNAFLSSFGVSDWDKQLADPAYACRIAEVDGAAVGYVKLGPLKLPVEEDSPSILLDQLYILKEHHGAGIARLLMGWALDEAARRCATRMYLTVYVDNHRARRFYDRYGFEFVKSYQFMVGTHADKDLIMRKLL